MHLVDSSPYDVIVGLDILSQLGSVTLNFQNNQLHLYTRHPRSSADIVKFQEQPPTWKEFSTWRVCATEAVQIPSCHYALIAGCCTEAPIDTDLHFVPIP